MIGDRDATAMDAGRFSRNHPERIEPLAPAAGGIRWRPDWQEVTNRSRRYGDACTFHSHADPNHDPEPEPPSPCRPVFTTTPPPEGRAGEEYVYQPSAFDGIANGFTWRLVKAPPGMSIDRHEGVVIWTPAEGGKASVTICARNVYGKESCQSWTICVRKAVVVKTVIRNDRYQTALRRKTRISLRVWRMSRRIIHAACRATAPPYLPEIRRLGFVPLRR